MDAVITLNDGLDAEGVYHLYLMSNQPIVRELPAGVEATRTVKAGVHILKAEWRYRGPARIICEKFRWSRMVVLWALEKGVRISEQGREAAQVYAEAFFRFPDFAWMSAPLPPNVEDGIVIPDSEMMLFEAGFVPAGFLAVGCGGVQPGLQLSVISNQ
jgi:hypothetical protein